MRIFQGRHRDNDLRTLLMAGSYTNEKGMTYNEFLGVADREEDVSALLSLESPRFGCAQGEQRQKDICGKHDGRQPRDDVHVLHPL